MFGIIGMITLLHKLIGFSNEISRKLIHVLVGFTWLPIYFYLRGTVHMIILPVIFVAVNWLSVHFNIFKSMERETDGKKKDLGTVYYAVCMTLMSVFTYIFPEKLPCYGIAVFCLSFGDGAAAIAGKLVKKYNKELMRGKTLAGTLACLFAAVIGVYFICAVIKQPISLLNAVIFGAVTAMFELFSGKYDNFTVSLGVMLTACLIL